MERLQECSGSLRQEIREQGKLMRPKSEDVVDLPYPNLVTKGDKREKLQLELQEVLPGQEREGSPWQHLTSFLLPRVSSFTLTTFTVDSADDFK